MYNLWQMLYTSSSGEYREDMQIFFHKINGLRQIAIVQ